ncbi:Pyruvate dehydrogenase E1 component subunit beta, mitochondrial [Dirofilaria immitis]|nr:Pyruvate dehydrogenase E1 component subunit beta, mitochondrial [Dirofilaria immitis]
MALNKLTRIIGRLTVRNVSQFGQKFAASTMSVRDALSMGLDEELSRDERVFCWVKKLDIMMVSRGLMKKFGESRVIDTPITEAGFCGLAVGAAFAGLRPICEFMTYNFSMQCIDQIINSAAKTYYMSAGQHLFKHYGISAMLRISAKLPDCFRGPNGAAAGVAAQHSQDFTVWYAHCPGLKVVTPYTSEDAKGLLKSAVRDDNPGLFFLGMSELTDGLSEFAHLQQREGTDITLISYSIGMVATLKAAEQLAKEGISAEVINLRSLRPFDFETVKKSVMKTHHVVTVDNGWPFCCIGSEICMQLNESDAYDALNGPVYRVTGTDVPMPFSESLEAAAQPQPADVIKMAKRSLKK